MKGISEHKERMSLDQFHMEYIQEFEEMKKQQEVEMIIRLQQQIEQEEVILIPLDQALQAHNN